MATKEDQETLRRFVQHVSRSFYEPKYVVVMDQLARHPVLKDDDLAGRMGLQIKELNKLMAVLSNDRLVHVYRQNELKEGAQRSVGKAYYYIDYQHFCNVVKWRIAEMRRIIDKEQRNELDTQGFLCPQCSKQFATTEADKLVDFVTGTFNCDVCHAELVNNEDSESMRAGQDRMQRFNRQMGPIRAGLRASEEMVMPAFDVAGYVKVHLVGTEADRQERLANGDGVGADGSRRRGDGELRIAGMGGGKREDQGVGVVMSLDVDEESARAERNRLAEAKKAQNALPAWHLQSTISGDLTALGIAESARRAAAAEAAGRSAGNSNDEILKGLGTVGIGAVKPEPGTGTSLVTVTDDVKPGTDPAADYYDHYYASLAASASASHSTPNSTGIVDDLVEEDEDIKPNVEYLNSLNDYRKRTRSEEESESVEERTRKVAKTAVDEALFGGDHPEDNVEDGSAPPDDDPIVYVNGEPIAYSAVTEEHQELMTPEEYQAYFDVYSARS